MFFSCGCDSLTPERDWTWLILVIVVLLLRIFCCSDCTSDY